MTKRTEKQLKRLELVVFSFYGSSGSTPRTPCSPAAVSRRLSAVQHHQQQSSGEDGDPGLKEQSILGIDFCFISAHLPKNEADVFDEVPRVLELSDRTLCLKAEAAACGRRA